MKSTKFIVNPNLAFQDDGRVKLLYFGITYTLPEKLYKFLRNHQDSKLLTMSSLQEIVDEKTLDLLISGFLIFTEEEADYLAWGIFDFTKSTTQHLNVFAEEELPDYGIIGLAIDSNNFGSYSCKYSPEGIRGCLTTDTKGKSTIIDCGDIQFYPHFEPISLIRHRLSRPLEVMIKKNTLPIFLGGDHSLTYYCIRSLIDQYKDDSIAVIQFDAHKDLSKTSMTNFDHLTNANFMRKLIKDEPNIRKVFQFGVRDETESNSDKVMQLKTSEIEKAISFIRQNNLRCYITVDMDCLDPSIAPEVNYAVDGGLQIDELSKAILDLKRECSLIGIDFMEVCLGKNEQNRTVIVTAELIKQIIA